MDYKILIKNNSTYVPLKEKVEIKPGLVIEQDYSASTEDELKLKINELLKNYSISDLKPYQDVEYNLCINSPEEDKPVEPKAKILKVLKAPTSSFDEDLSEDGIAFRNNQDAIDLLSGTKENEIVIAYRKGSLKSGMSKWYSLDGAGKHNYVCLFVSFDQPTKELVSSFIIKEESKPATFIYGTLCPFTTSLTVSGQAAAMEAYPDLIKENTYLIWVPVDAIVNQKNNNLSDIVFNNSIIFNYSYLKENSEYEEGSYKLPKKISDTNLRIMVREA